MKYRLGFVSNSSTTSFCIVGAKISKGNKEYKKLCKKFEDEWSYGEEKIELFVDEEGEECIIGYPFMDIGLDQTLKQYKQQIIKKLQSIIKIKDEDPLWFMSGEYVSEESMIDIQHEKKID